MPSKTRSVTIELTPRQQEKLRQLAGQEHSQFHVEVAKGRTARSALSAKVAPRTWIDSGVRGGNLPPSGLPVA